MDVRLPDGTVIRGVPDDMTKDQLSAKLKANGYNLDGPPQKSSLGAVGQHIGNAAAGLVRGAGSIGATLLAPVDMVSDAIDGKGLSLDKNQRRRQAMDDVLQSAGAEPDSWMYQGAKLGGEVAGTLGLGGVVGNAVAQVAPRVGAAIASGGMSTGGRVAPELMSRAADLGIRAGGGAINGGLSAALVDPRDAPMGFAIGGSIPVVTKAAGALGQFVGAAVSPTVAKNRASNKLVEAIGDGGVQQAIGDMQTYYPKGAEKIPVSVAAQTNNPAVARLEQGSRLAASPLWYEFDQKQGKAVFDNVMGATKEADDIAARALARRENWATAWENASQAQKPRIWNQRMGQLGGDIETALQSPQASNPAVRNVLDAVKNEVIRVGPSFSPGHLQQLRANLSGKVNSMSPDVFKSAPRDNPAIISLIKEMDDILNVSTGGKWQKVIEGYAEDSTSLHASKAAQKVRNSFIDGETGRVRGVSLDAAGDVPKITEAGLGRAMDAARLPDGTLSLSPAANQQLEATLGALRRQNVVQGVKRSATAGGGSNTVDNSIAAGMSGAGAPNMLMQMIGAARKIGTAKTDTQLAALLSNPDEAVKVLEAYLKPKAPNRLAAMASRAAPVLATGQ